MTADVSSFHAPDSVEQVGREFAALKTRAETAMTPAEAHAVWNAVNDLHDRLVLTGQPYTEAQRTLFSEFVAVRQSVIPYLGDYNLMGL